MRQRGSNVFISAVKSASHLKICSANGNARAVKPLDRLELKHEENNAAFTWSPTSKANAVPADDEMERLDRISSRIKCMTSQTEEKTTSSWAALKQ